MEILKNIIGIKILNLKIVFKEINIYIEMKFGNSRTFFKHAGGTISRIIDTRKSAEIEFPLENRDSSGTIPFYQSVINSF